VRSTLQAMTSATTAAAAEIDTAGNDQRQVQQQPLRSTPQAMTSATQQQQGRAQMSTACSEHNLVTGQGHCNRHASAATQGAEEARGALQL